MSSEDKDKEPEVVNKPAEIRTKMADHLQGIFNKQKLEKKTKLHSRFSVIDAIKNKESPLYCQIMDNFKKKIAIQEEIVRLKIMKNKYGWQLDDRLKSLNEEVIVLKDNELAMETLNTLELLTEGDDLIEVVLSKMRIHTSLFQTELNKQKRTKKRN